MSTLKVALLGMCSTLVLVGCSSNFASSVRKVTYPPDFKYTEQVDLRSDMHQLAYQMALLDTALITPDTQNAGNGEIQREKVLKALKSMGRIASRLEAGSTGANHPFMDDYMQDLTAKIDKASIAASFKEPRYYFAGQVSGGCVNCHKVNR
jgi:hypothetical protein